MTLNDILYVISSHLQYVVVVLVCYPACRLQTVINQNFFLQFFKLTSSNFRSQNC